MNQAKILRIAFFSLIVVLIAVTLFQIATGSSSSGVSLGINLSIALLAIVVLGLVVSFVISIINNPKSALRSGIGLVVLGVLFLISWVVAKGELLPWYADYGVTTASFSKIISGEIIFTFILLILLAVAIIGSSVKRLFN